MRWEIKPCIGLGPITFGMTEQGVAELAARIGPITARFSQPDGAVTEHRGLDAPSIAYRDGKVVYMAVGRQAGDVVWRDFDVFKEKPETLLQLLEASAGGAEIGLGAVSFPDFGLDATGFYFAKERLFFRLGGREQDDRTIALYDRAEYEKAREQFKTLFRPISFQKSTAP